MKFLKRRGAARQRGHEILEFALVAFLFIPLLLGTFVTGMNVIRSIQANHIARDLADMYIHGGDFSDHGMQVVAQRLATGMDLQIANGSGSQADNINNGGRGIVWISKIMWVGTTLEPNCQAALPSFCTNANKFVFLERIRFGNGSLESERPSSLGHPAAATRSVYGIVTDNTVTSSNAAVPEPFQTSVRNLWQSTSTTTGQQPLSDGQVVYVAEVYFQSPDLQLGSFQGRGVFAGWFY
ncbi:MAG: TadE family protein [Acidobacteriota bacterium]